MKALISYSRAFQGSSSSKKSKEVGEFESLVESARFCMGSKRSLPKAHCFPYMQNSKLGGGRIVEEGLCESWGEVVGLI